MQTFYNVEPNQFTVTIFLLTSSGYTHTLQSKKYAVSAYHVPVIRITVEFKRCMKISVLNSFTSVTFFTSYRKVSISGGSFLLLLFFSNGTFTAYLL